MVVALGVLGGLIGAFCQRHSGYEELAEFVPRLTGLLKEWSEMTERLAARIARDPDELGAAAVDYLEAVGMTGTATVENGRYVAWGPGQAFTNLEAPSGHGGPEPMFTYDLTLADGTVVRDATPARPSGASGGAGRSGR